MDERYTNFYLNYDIQDVTAARDSHFTTSDSQQYFTNIDKLVAKESPDIQFPRFTFEHNFNVLDGSLFPMEEDEDVEVVIPYFTSVLSDENGEFETNPSITIDFTRPHSSFAFMFYFLEDYPLEMELTFWDDTNNLINRYTIYPDSLTYTTFGDIYGYQKILIVFKKTLPKRYIKLKYIKYGTVITWDETNVQNASVVQQTDRLSKSLSIDTLSFTVIDVEGKLNVGNAAGMHKYFQRNQIMYPYEEVIDADGNKTTVQLGKYYLKTFSENTNLGKMSAQSYLGLMDDITFYGGEVYNGTLAGTVIEKIFETMELEEYVIDEETYNTPLYGTITPKSCRKALNEVLFAVHSVIDSHDLDNVIIKKSTAIQRPDLVKNQKFSTSTKKNDYVYGVDVKYTTYTIADERKEVAKGTYSAGTYTLYFTQPYSSLIINTGTIDTQSTYSVTFTVDTDSEVVISGYAYTTATSIARVTHDSLQAGQKESISTYSTALCSGEQALKLAKQLLDYLSFDLTINVKMLADDNKMDDFHIIENPVDRFNNYYGMFTKRTLNLTGGFIDTATLIGSTVVEPIYGFARTSNYELYAGSETII